MRRMMDRTISGLWHWGLAACLLVASAVSQAGVVGLGAYTVGGHRAGLAGQQVSLSFSEAGLSGFDAAALTFSFDSSLLSFAGVADDCTASPDICSSPVQLSDDGTTALFSLFLMTSNGSLSGDARLFTLFFDIKGTAAPGDTLVSFVNDFTDFSDPSATQGIYDRESLSGTLTVLSPTAANPLPVMGSGALSLTALALMAGCLWQQRRRAAARADA